jgi:hypothetical protein
MHLRTRVLPIALMLVLSVLLGGCAGSVDIPGTDLLEIGLSMVLRVQDAAGNAIGDARIYVDGSRDNLFTDPDFWGLGAGFPAGWQGFQANWFSDRWSLYGDDPSQRGGRVELVVRKLGWTSGLTIAIIPDSPDEHFWVRDVITLFPEGSVGPDPNPQYAEVLAGPKMTPAAAGEPPRRIRLNDR